MCLSLLVSNARSLGDFDARIGDDNVKTVSILRKGEIRQIKIINSRNEFIGGRGNDSLDMITVVSLQFCNSRVTNFISRVNDPIINLLLRERCVDRYLLCYNQPTSVITCY